MSWIKVFAPASIGNIGPGFDVLGLAIDTVGDIIRARKIDEGIIISEITGLDNLPKEAGRNTAGIAASEVLKEIGTKGGIEIKLEKGVPAGSGLGSSASSAAAGAFAANYLYGEKLSKEELIDPATIAESFVSGGYFADNTAPSLLGGATITRNKKPLDVIKLGSIDELIIVVTTPEYKLLTKKARDILPEWVPMEGFISNMANACLIASAFSKNDYQLLARSIHDYVIEPVRAELIPGFKDVKKAALDADADGCSISGAGPSLFAITNDKNKAEEIGRAMEEAFLKNGLKSVYRVCRAYDKGTTVIKE